MAQNALESAEHGEITRLATAIVSAQQIEIAEMRTFKAAWSDSVSH